MQHFEFKVFPQNNYMDLTLIQFGREICKGGYSFGPAARNHYLFHFVISGKGTLYANNSSGTTDVYKINTNEGFMLFPGQVSTYIADNDEPWEYIWLEFDGFQAKATINATGLSQDKPIYHPLSIELRELALDEMIYIIEHKEAAPLHLIGHLYLFLDYLTRSAVTSKSQNKRKNNSSHYYISEAIKFIELNYQKDITVEDIAENCGLNRNYFGKKFKEEFGKTPQEFLMQYRMTKATELLEHSQLSIGEISCAVGYNDQFHFSRAFKNTYGISPRQWRDKYSSD